jgi:hypothetical protein
VVLRWVKNNTTTHAFTFRKGTMAVEIVVLNLRVINKLVNGE